MTVDGKERVMGSTGTRIAVSLAASVAAVSALAGTAGARLPEADFGEQRARPAVVAVPDAFERAVQRRTRTLEAQYAGPDAVARAIARRNR